MHTLMVLVAGLVLLAALVILARVIGFSSGASAIAFIPLWFFATALNMWIGVTRAGYTTAQEFPIFLLLFTLPSIIAMVIWWRNAKV